MSRDYRGREMELGIYREIVEGDIADIRSCGTLLVMFDKPSVGTAMEIRFAAKEVLLPVHVVDISGKPLSPWLVYHATQVYGSLASACAAIRSVLGVAP